MPYASVVAMGLYGAVEEQLKGDALTPSGRGFTPGRVGFALVAGPAI